MRWRREEVKRGRSEEEQNLRYSLLGVGCSMFTRYWILDSGCLMCGGEIRVWVKPVTIQQIKISTNQQINLLDV